jgi:hypothetical protein
MDGWISLTQRNGRVPLHLPIELLVFSPIARHQEQGCFVYLGGVKIEVCETEAEIKRLVGIK